MLRRINNRLKRFLQLTIIIFILCLIQDIIIITVFSLITKYSICYFFPAVLAINIFQLISAFSSEKLMTEDNQ